MKKYRMNSEDFKKMVDCLIVLIKHPIVRYDVKKSQWE